MDIHFYREFKNFCFDYSTNVTAEVALWRATIIQAFTDSLCRSRKKKTYQLKLEAKNWLLYDKHDFFDVCRLAEVDPYLIRQKAIFMLEDEADLKKKRKKSKAKVKRTAYKTPINLLHHHLIPSESLSQSVN